MMSLFNRTVDVLTGMLNYRAKRHQLLLSNVANIDVEDYRPSDIVRKNPTAATGRASLSVRPRTTAGRHLPGLSNFRDHIGEVETTTSDEKVSLDQQMASLSENNLMYNATIEMLARKLRNISTVVKETR